MLGAVEEPVAIAAGAGSQTSQVTSVFEIPATVALNCCVPVRTTVTCPTAPPPLVELLMVTVTGVEEPLPQPAITDAASKIAASFPNFIHVASITLRSRAFRMPSPDLIFPVSTLAAIICLESPADGKPECASRFHQACGEPLHLLIKYLIQRRNNLRLQHPRGQGR